MLHEPSKIIQKKDKPKKYGDIWIIRCGRCEHNAFVYYHNKETDDKANSLICSFRAMKDNGWRTIIEMEYSNNTLVETHYASCPECASKHR